MDASTKKRIWPGSLALALLAALLLTCPVLAEEPPPEEPALVESGASETTAVAEEAEPAAEGEPVVEPGTVVQDEVQEEVQPLPDEPAVEGEPAVEPGTAAQDEAQEEVQPLPDEPAEPVQEAVNLDAPQVEMPQETPAESTPACEPVEQESDSETAAAVDAPLPDPYFYDAAHVVHHYATISLAVNNFTAQGGKGMIYVESGTFPEVVSVSGVAGLTGIVFQDYYPAEASAAFDPYDYTTWPTIEGWVTVENQTTGFTLLGFNISTGSAGSLVSLSNNTGTLNLSYLNIENTGTGAGLSMNTNNGAVNISHVRSRGNGGNGAEVGFVTPVQGTVTISDSSFDHNGGTYGLTVVATGLVTLNGVSSSSNDVNGARIQSRGALIKNSVFNHNDVGGTTGSGIIYTQNGSGNLTLEEVQLNGNTQYGLSAGVWGNISLKNVRADSNGYSGVTLDTCDESGGICGNPSSGNVTVTHSYFENNSWRVSSYYGLDIYTAKGSITLTDVHGLTNGDADSRGVGAYLSNRHSPAKSPVTLTDCSFDGNRDRGMSIYSNGAITLKGVSASENSSSDYGAFIDNTYGSGGVVLQASSLSSNYFNQNDVDDASLWIESDGSVTVRQTWVEDNDLNTTIGMRIGTDGNVVVSGGGFNRNGNTGMIVITQGTISVTLTDSGASQNAGRGLSLENTAASGRKSITVDGGDYSNNDSNGINILSNGVITLKNLTANKNDYYGAYLVNNTSPSNSGISVLTTRSGWSNEFDENGELGLYIATKGAVSISKSQANNNDSYGMRIENTGTGNVTLNQVTANQNCSNVVSSSGIRISARGNVTLTGVTATANGDGAHANAGAGIDNSLGGASNKPVVVRNSTFNGNFGPGLGINSLSSVTLSSVTASYNYIGGCDITNSGGTALSPVTVTGSTFDSNQAVSGLKIDSRGTVKLTTVNASGNAFGRGVQIDNAKDTAHPVNVTFTCPGNGCLLQTNNEYGLDVNSYGSITISGVNAEGNNISGAYLRNATVLDNRPKNVTVSNATFGKNLTGFGIQVDSKGTISLTNVNAAGNALYGAQLNNTTSPNAAPVTLTGNSDWDLYNGNEGYGLSIASKGQITLNRIEASNNVFHGAVLNNSTSITPKSINVSNAEFNDNMTDDATYDFGLYVFSNGAITLNQVTADGNGDADTTVVAGIQTNNTINVATITLTNVSANSNNGTGLSVHSNANITARNLAASYNNGNGADIFTVDGVGNLTLGHTGSTINRFNNNTNAGARLNATGTMNVSYVEALDNGNEAGVTGEYGLSVANNGALSPKNVTVSHITASRNDDENLRIRSSGSVTLSDVVANESYRAAGISIINTYSIGYAVKITRAIANDNAVRGIDVASEGQVTLNTMQANNNGGAGIYVDNWEGTGGISLTGNVNTASHNDEYGVYFFTEGNISVANLTAEYNEDNGAYLNAIAGGGGSGSITVNKAYLHNNYSEGLSILAANDCTLSTMQVFNNGDNGDGSGDHSGAYITIFGNSLTVTNSAFLQNWGFGLQIDETGGTAITITNTLYMGNDADNDSLSDSPDVYIY
jgi:hypothetical protein